MRNHALKDFLEVVSIYPSNDCFFSICAQEKVGKVICGLKITAL